MNNTNFKNLLKELGPEFGYLGEAIDFTNLTGKPIANKEEKERNSIERSILNQLDKSEKLDKVDTITFGLETDDNKVVKVYVNAEQAADFEKELSQQLGEIDDIEEILNTLSTKFEIVDVEWPDEEGSEDNEDEEDSDMPTGAESMDDRVHNKNTKFEVEKPGASIGMTENLSYGERITSELTESMSPIEQRLSTPSQLLIYHAVLALGIPEVVLTKSPYRSAIVQAIKQQAIEINKRSELKLALKGFVRYATDSNDSNTEVDDTEVNKDSKDKPSEKEKTNIKEDLNQGLAFWDAVKSILKHVTVNETSYERLVNCAAWNRLIARSQSRAATKFIGVVERRINGLVEMLPVKVKESITESISVVEFENLLKSLFEFADPDLKKKYSGDLIDTPQMRQFLVSIKSGLSQKFTGTARTRMQALLTTLSQKSDKVEEVAEAVVVNAKDEGPWTFESNDEGLSITHGEHLAMVLDEQNVELLSKGITNKRAIVVKDVDGAKFTFSPRGVIVKVKASGTNSMCEMASEDVNSLMEAIIESEKKKEVTESVEEQWVVIGNPGRSQPSSLWPKTEAPTAMSEVDALEQVQSLKDKQSSTTYGVQPSSVHWHAKPLSNALNYVSGVKAVNAIKDLQLKLSENIGVHYGRLEGHKVEYHSYDMWKKDIPKKSSFVKGNSSVGDGHLERAQSMSKTLEGISGTWDNNKKSGWIYSHYLDKKNLREETEIVKILP